MFRKMIVILTFAFLAIIPAFATSPADNFPQIVYDEIKSFCKENILPQNKGPITSTVVLTSDPLEGNGKIIVRFRDEIISLGNKTISTPEEFKEALKPYEG